MRTIRDKKLTEKIHVTCEGDEKYKYSKEESDHKTGIELKSDSVISHYFFLFNIIIRKKINNSIINGLNASKAIIMTISLPPNTGMINPVHETTITSKRNTFVVRSFGIPLKSLFSPGSSNILVKTELNTAAIIPVTNSAIVNLPASGSRVHTVSMTLST